MTQDIKTQDDLIQPDDAFLLPKITNVESIACFDVRRKRKPSVTIPEEFLRRSARIKERKEKLKHQTNDPQYGTDENAALSKRSKPGRSKTTKRKRNNSRRNNASTNACVQRETANTQCRMVIWRNVEQSPNFPVVSTPRNEPHANREPDRVLGLVRKDEKIFVLVKWRHTDAPEYMEKRKCSPEILLMLNEFLNPAPSEERSEPRQEESRSEPRQEERRSDPRQDERIKSEREEATYDAYRERQQTAHMIQIHESSRNENYSSLHIKLE